MLEIGYDNFFTALKYFGVERTRPGLPLLEGPVGYRNEAARGFSAAGSGFRQSVGRKR